MSRMLYIIDENIIKEPSRRNKRGFLYRVMLKDYGMAIGTALIILFIIIAVFAPWIAPYDPAAQDYATRLSAPSWDHLLGTDTFGRDVLSRIIFGARVSLTVGVLATAGATGIGVVIGVVSGYFGGKIDNLITRVIDILMAFPMLLLGLMFVAALGSSFVNLILAIGIAMGPRFVRLARGETLAVKSREYIQAAKAVGASDFRIMFVHLLPNVLPSLIVMSTLYIGNAIIVEAGLSFIGLGIPPPAPTWGEIARDGVSRLRDAPWMSISSGLAIFLITLALNIVGDGLRDELDPQI